MIVSKGNSLLEERSQLREAVRKAYLTPEAACVNGLLKTASLSSTQLASIEKRTRVLIQKVRKAHASQVTLETFLAAYDLSTQEGIVLMCLAEALLRIPDAKTADDLIRDKLMNVDWLQKIGSGDSFLTNAPTWGLMLTGKTLKFTEGDDQDPTHHRVFKSLIRKSGEPVIRQAIRQAMRILGRQFVMGDTIQSAIKRAQGMEKKGYSYSYDMLGEAACTERDAQRYFDAYKEAIETIGETDHQGGISIKLSALHPRYEVPQYKRVMTQLVPRVLELVNLCREKEIPCTIDAEEAERLDISLDVFEAVYRDKALQNWDKFGLVVQAYQKRGLPVIRWLAELSKAYKRQIPIRLVKGAYWDSEIKLAQEKGLSGYPVFTRKSSTDVSYVACAKELLKHGPLVYPQFATHNAHTVSTILELLDTKTAHFEFQRIHGMGEVLYETIKESFDVPVRIYAPVGIYKDLLPYLVRRLLENGANTSFVNKLTDSTISLDILAKDPLAKVKGFQEKPHPAIPLPRDLFEPERANAMGLDLTDVDRLRHLKSQMDPLEKKSYTAGPFIKGKLIISENKSESYEPARHSQKLGEVHWATDIHIEEALKTARSGFADWSKVSLEKRAAILNKAAALLEERIPQFISLIVREGGRTLGDALSEVREAIDFCRYYAVQAREDLLDKALRGPTGETNVLSSMGRGTFVCISPWNFPLAIFMGQMTAALVAGNSVIAKPASQTPMIALMAVKLLHEAGVPVNTLTLLPASGSLIGSKLLPDPRVNGVVFTGSTETAWTINQTLAQKKGTIIPFIAETGGINAMIVDSSALLEQVVHDVIVSAFQSAGQRCSALRILYIQEDIADALLEMLIGATAELTMGDPGLLKTDIGPVIDKGAQESLLAYAQKRVQSGKLLYKLPLHGTLGSGSFVTPHIFELEKAEDLTCEIFGPMLHVVRYKANQQDQVIASINGTHYGLTFGIHSRIERTIEYIQSRVQAGNIYVNRSIIGAVVGVQPFGGHGLSGTGPKAGGPHYLARFTTEKTVTVDTTASGGNATLLTLGED
ncbi:MAG: bifunctional proline dehydrogenase/L-glutamate gamma-semialdehyde dehydrogenase PutA [Alphaproteobacteria bacterium]|nr:bifunctional proline dehydrogenase/L-glutamate gamma-semialdehyde dehydrogenase PutA [Alphaproteobacteria bacterium]MBT5390380.1 bifunctional proline dehydrogenase/L-glutamate gamma-semialdehyde dehydrogenase PutA [Alphaproteobacteria bacterium]